MLKSNRYLKAFILLNLSISLVIGACGRRSRDNSSLQNSPIEIKASSSKELARIPTDLEPLALSADGLSIADESSQKMQTVFYGTDSATTQTAISKVLGKPVRNTKSSECGAGAMNFITWSNSLMINVMQGKFVGWSVQPDTKSANLTTVDGIGLGKTLADLKANYSVEVMESSLGTEFYTSTPNSLSGLLSTNASDGIITALWSGTVCNFR